FDDLIEKLCFGIMQRIIRDSRNNEYINSQYQFDMKKNCGEMNSVFIKYHKEMIEDKKFPKSLLDIKDIWRNKENFKIKLTELIEQNERNAKIEDVERFKEFNILPDGNFDIFKDETEESEEISVIDRGSQTEELFYI